jgi:hypothetical protein
MLNRCIDLWCRLAIWYIPQSFNSKSKAASVQSVAQVRTLSDAPGVAFAQRHPQSRKDRDDASVAALRFSGVERDRVPVDSCCPSRIPQPGEPLAARWTYISQ